MTSMHDFHTVLHEINERIYRPNKLVMTDIQEEKQNARYGAGSFQLSAKRVRFRIAKITAKKIGQFVAFWEKDAQNINQAYTYESAPDLLVITCFKNKDIFGQFIFPKEVLRRKKILTFARTKGKMGMRVYPPWDQATSVQANHTQKWQLAYFVLLSEDNEAEKEKMMQLYTAPSL